MQDLARKEIKGYQLLERIGTGGFGAVYRAHQSTIGREVAIKVILPGHANHPDFVRRFESEAQLVARLEHHHIVPLYDFWRDPEGAYLVMRWLRGGSLHDQIKAQGAMSIEDASMMIDQIAAALHIAHRSRVIHRDIKPGNILLDEDGNAFVADFGIAKDHAVSQAVTEADAIIGSPDYLSPEQARSEAVTPQTDIYSLGVVLYEMLQGEHPFPGLSPIERLYKHLNEPLPQLRIQDDSIRDAINDVIQKATVKDPMQRFKDVMEMAQMLREAARLDSNQAGTTLVELLTPREQEVLSLVIAGKSNREIADKLVLSLATVKTYINKVYRKLNVRSRVQAIVKARELDLIVNRSEPLISSISQMPEPENPYKGLRAFQAADAQDFFGRDKLVNKLMNRLQQDLSYRRFLAVVGPSGSGKSSAVKAGLIPALWRGEIPGSENWYMVELVPGRHPLDELEVALTRVASQETLNLNEHLSRDERGLLRAANLILPDDGSELLIVIDQFEELFTLVADESERQHFLNLLRYAITEERSRVRMLVTLRADYYDRPLQYPDFGLLIQNRTETVLPLSADELEQAVRQPAEQVGVRFEDGLVSRIVSDVHYQPGALPLLQYALTELFERREGRRLTIEAYQAIGGTGGALANRADELFHEDTDEHRELIRQMFLRLVTLGEGAEDTRRRVERAELLDIASDRDMMDEIIDVYADSRLLSLDNDPETRRPTVEVAHEALLREWDRLRHWLNESRDDIRQERDLAKAAADWDLHNRDTSYLLRGARLEQVETWQDSTGLILTSLETEFIKSSLLQRRVDEQARQAQIEREKAQEAAQRQLELRNRTILRVLLAVFVIASIVSAGFAFIASTQRARAVDSEQEALIQASIGLASQAMLELDGNFPDRAVPLALEALENYPYTWQAERALAQSVLNNRLLFSVDSHTALLTEASWSPDDRMIASSSFDGTTVIRDGLTGEELHVLSANGAQVAHFDWSPDATRIVTVGADGVVDIWDTLTGEQLMSFADHTRLVLAVAWSPDGQYIATTSRDGTAIIRDATTGDILHSFQRDPFFGALAWSPDSTQIAIGDVTGSISIFDRISGDLLMSLNAHSDWINKLHWSPESNHILSASDDGDAILWDAASGDLLQRFSGHSDRIWDAQWAIDEVYAVTYSRDGTTRIWDAASGEVHRIFSPGEPGIIGAGIPIRGLTVSPQGERIAITRFDGSFTVIDVESGRVLFSRVGHVGAIISIDWAHTGNRLLSGAEDGTLRIWDVSSPAIQLETSPETLYVDWSPDGQWIAACSHDGTLRVWNAESLELVMLETIHETGNAVLYWSPDSTRLVVSARLPESRLSVIDAFTGEVLTVFDEHQAGIHEFQWSPDGTRIVSGDQSGAIWIWDANSGEPLLDYTEHQGSWAFSVDWSPDGTRIVSSDITGRIHIWNAETAETVRTLSTTEIGATSKAIWSPDGSLIATHSDDNTGGRIWDMESGEVIATFRGNAGTVWGLQWTSEGDRIITSGMDGRLNVFDTASGAHLIEIDFPVSLSGLAISADSQRYVFAAIDYVRILEIPWEDTQSLIDYARDCCLIHELTTDEREQFGLPQP